MTASPAPSASSTISSDLASDQGPTSNHTVAIVGAGLAGLRSVAALREAGFGGKLIVYGSEPYRPYDRPPLSKELFTSSDPRWLEQDLNINLEALATVHLDDPVRSVRHDGQQFIVTSAHQTERAHALVGATGAVPIIPDSLSSGLVLRTLDDALALRTKLTPGKRIAIIGAGWIGSEIASVASDRGCHVTVIEAGATPLVGALGPAAGSILIDWFSRAHVVFLPHTRAERITAAGVQVRAAGKLSTINADTVIVALGARPALDWLRQLVPAEALDSTGHLPVDAHHRALMGPAMLYGVGDCAARRSPRFGIIPGGHWDGALRDPVVMAASLMGALGQDAGGNGRLENNAEDPTPYIFSTQFGHDLALFGHPAQSDSVVLAPGSTTSPGVDHGNPLTASWIRRESGRDSLAARLVVDQPREVSRTRKLFKAAWLPEVG